ncbi:Heat shock 70 kDa protein 17 [Forsythia ovata]|uniref:Heat shock 70 kDa protein 17 n=1 Tax=Forsythia ovata TaxID=205694 RepID=A0ABD1TSW2_9LAMI
MLYLFFDAKVDDDVLKAEVGEEKTVVVLVYTKVKDVRWDAELGGQNMELRLVEYFADEFNKQLGSGVDIRNNAKAMAKLKKQVKRTKEILCANKMAPISVESL